MSETGEEHGRPMRRRAVLSSASLAVAGSMSGCLRRMRTLMDAETPEQVTIEIKTVPSDDDTAATQIARHLEGNLDKIGVHTDLVLVREDEFHREVLINRDFDIFVGQYPPYDDPDFLRPLLHSRFGNEQGWQNPFDYTDLTLDEALEDQRGNAGDERRGIVGDIQMDISRDQPFTVVAMPDEIRAVSHDRFDGWRRFPLGNPLSFLSLDRMDESNTSLRVGMTDDRVTQNLNPISVEFRRRGTITGLLYDSLARRYDGAVRPWLADEWEFRNEGGTTIASITLRGGLQWHDGTALTADDVAFTYEFLEDTSLSQRDAPIPSPRFRGRTSLVTGVQAIGDREVRMTFAETSPEVAERALTVPLLPEWIWEGRSGGAELGGVSAAEHITEALVTSNAEPLGAGPLQFEDSVAGEELVLSPFEDHFLHTNPPENYTDTFGAAPAFDEVVISVVRSGDAAVQLLDDGAIDVTLSTLNASVIPAIGQSERAGLRVDRSRQFYLVGFNTQTGPLNNPHFRRICAQILDKEGIVDEVFDGFARPIASPLDGTRWLHDELEWDGEDPVVPFLGTEGELDVEHVRSQLTEQGFEFGAGGELLRR